MRKQFTLQQIRITNVLDIKSVFDTENLHKNTHTHITHVYDVCTFTGNTT